MGDTPKQCEETHDSGCASSFDTSNYLFESTPKSISESTPSYHNVSRKRKAHFYEAIHSQKLADVMEASPDTPPFSSTLNDSLMKHLVNVQLEHEITQPQKFFKTSNSKLEVRSAPVTPQKQKKTEEQVRKPGSSFVKLFSNVSMQSPLKEQHDILYSSLKPLEPQKKLLTPQKFKAKLNDGGTPAKKCLFPSSTQQLFKKVVSNRIIMRKVFSNLSSGDLYRLHMVSRSFKQAILGDNEACQRLNIYLVQHKTNKENYIITPPSSPEKEEELSGSESPTTRKFKEFFKAKNDLTQDQTLDKCLQCNKPSVVQYSIVQCRNPYCGYIYCKTCFSSSYKPEDFNDSCQNSLILNSSQSSTRKKLEDLSNCMFNISESSFLSSTRIDSGFYSEQDSSHTPLRVKRNLNKSFGVVNKSKILFEHNRMSRSREVKKTSTPVLPVIENKCSRKSIEVMEPSSPPRVKMYAACSKQSKRNLKRLTQ